MANQGHEMILVTGGTGYVGSVLVPRLAREGYKVRVYCSQLFGNSIEGLEDVEFIQGDIRDTTLLDKAMEDVTHVIHLAGVVTDELVAMNPSLAYQINVEATGELCRIGLSHKISRLVYASSSSIYGSVDHDVTEDAIPCPITEYGQMKLDGEKVIREFREQFTVTYLRSATACGPAPRMRLDTIVNIFSKQAWFDHHITVHGGGQWRSNIHVEDVAKAYHALLQAAPHLVHDQAFNCTRSNLQALVIAQMVQSAYETFGGCAIHVDSSKQDPRNYRLSTQKLINTLVWYPWRSIYQAIQDNFTWFQSGGIQEPNSDLYYNNRRMASMMKEGV